MPLRSEIDLHEGALEVNVVDIRRFSTHDGQGIRTTIYLKGCGLRCGWCQNPETIDPRINPVFFRSRCIDCGLCLPKSRSGEARRDDAGRIRVDTTISEGDWDALVRVCPTEAIAFDATRLTVDQLVERASRDRAFFGAGGGVTLSGGEPLFLPRLAAALLKALKAADIDTAVETALDVRGEFIAGILPWTDQIFADCKLIDPDAHQRHTGRTNQRILVNLAGLLTGERRGDVTVRTPLIPGITDGEENITGIAQLISGLYPDVRYELLNYNPLAAAKYDVLLGKRFVFEKSENPQMLDHGQIAALREVARRAGVKHIVGA